MNRLGLTSRRITLLLSCWLLAFGIIGARLVQVQALQADRYERIRERQVSRSTKLPARRGELLDRTGATLAMSVPTYTVIVDPRLSTSPDADAARLAKALPDSSSVLSNAFRRKGRYVVVARSVDQRTADRVRALKIAAVGLEQRTKRVNPAGDLGRSILGRVDNDEVGISGLELSLERQLRGRAGEQLVERDQRGREIAAGQRREIPAQSGADIVSTIDRSFQFEVERILVNAVNSSHALGGIVIVTDPRDGDILALANAVATPDGNLGGLNARIGTRNDAFVSMYEPGSTMKPIMVAAALQAGSVRDTDRLVVPDRLQVSDHLFRDDTPHPTMAWTIRDVLVESSNVGTIMVAKKLGKERINSMLHSFGFGERTAVEFPHEVAGRLRAAKDWTGTSIGTVPIGQGISVTAIQMLSAMNVIANDGRRVEPRLVRSTIDPLGRTRTKPIVDQGQVIRPEVAQQVRSMLRGVVESGTGQNASVPGYSVAGKTGTARKVVNGRYKPGAYIASFAGMLPAEKPRLSIIVVLDEPYPIYGGIVAAPVFSQIAQFGTQHYRIAPTKRLTKVVTAVRQVAPSTTIAVPEGVPQVAERPRPTTATRPAGTGAATTTPASRSRRSTGEPPSVVARTSAAASVARQVTEPETASASEGSARPGESTARPPESTARSEERRSPPAVAPVSAGTRRPSAATPVRTRTSPVVRVTESQPTPAAPSPAAGPPVSPQQPAEPGASETVSAGG